MHLFFSSGKGKSLSAFRRNQKKLSDVVFVSVVVVTFALATALFPSAVSSARVFGIATLAFG